MKLTYLELSDSIPRPADELIYRKVDSPDGSFWLVPVNIPNVADFVHFAPKPADQKTSQGYGGSTLTFNLDDGSSIKVKGPWHGNAESLFEHTGVDVRDKHYTRVAVGLTRVGWPECNSVCGAVEDIVYSEPEPVLGLFTRDKDIARTFAKDLGQTVYVIMASSGGGSSYEQKPD